MEACASSKRVSGEKVTQGGTGYLRRAHGVSVEGLAMGEEGQKTEAGSVVDVHYPPPDLLQSTEGIFLREKYSSPREYTPVTWRAAGLNLLKAEDLINSFLTAKFVS